MLQRQRKTQMKKYALFLLFIVSAVVLYACSAIGDVTNESMSEITGLGNEHITQEVTESEANSSEQGDTTDDIIFMMDDLSADLWYYVDAVIPTSKGFFRKERSVNDNFLYYYDEEGEKHLVCGDPDCKHNDDKCSAYIPANHLTYWDGRIYYVTVSKTNAREMISMLPDASDRRIERSNIGEYEPEGHNGWLFGSKGFYQHYYLCDMMVDTIVIEGDEQRTYTEHLILFYDLLKPEEEPVCLSRGVLTVDHIDNQAVTRWVSGEWAQAIGPSNGKFYFTEAEGDVFDQESPVKLLAWSFEDRQFETLRYLPSNVRMPNAIRGDMLYYQVPGEGVFRTSIYGGGPVKIISAEPYLNVIQIDDRYIFMSTETEYQIYDLEGKLLNNLPLTREMQNWKLILLSKWKDKLLFGTRGNGERKIVYTLDYTKIGTDELQWEAFP